VEVSITVNYPLLDVFLTKPADLRDRGVITDEEFQRGKLQLLN